MKKKIQKIEDIPIPQMWEYFNEIGIDKGILSSIHKDLYLSENLDRKTFIIYARFQGLTVNQSKLIWDLRVESQKQFQLEFEQMLMEAKNAKNTVG